jgi:hypothetical protein
MRELATDFADDIAENDLYFLYLDFVEQTCAEIKSRTVPGSYRDRLLRYYRPLPREHFEARLESLRGNVAEYRAAVASLRRGFVPRRESFGDE